MDDEVDGLKKKKAQAYNNKGSVRVRLVRVLCFSSGLKNQVFLYFFFFFFGKFRSWLMLVNGR